MRIGSTIFLFLCVTAMTALPYTTLAQTPSEVVSNMLQLKVTPSYPQPGEAFTATLNSFSVTKTSIRWFINGKEDTSSIGKNSISLTAGNTGTPTNITAQITTKDGITVNKQYTVIPQRVDIIITSDALVPPFYNGRALPSSGSSVTATALVFTTNNTLSNQYRYVWKINGKVQNGGSGYGNITFIPNFETNVVLTLDVQDSNGKVLTQKSQSIPIVQPELYFYEQNPLRGLSFTALKDPYIFIGDEMTIRAEGYFMNKELGGTTILRQWSIDNKDVTTNGDEPEEITVTKDGNDSSSKLSFHIRNLKQLLQGVKKDITITF